MTEQKAKQPRCLQTPWCKHDAYHIDELSGLPSFKQVAIFQVGAIFQVSAIFQAGAIFQADAIFQAVYFLQAL